MAECVNKVEENVVLQETLNRSRVLQDALRRSRSYLGGAHGYGSYYGGYGGGYGHGYGYPYGYGGHGSLYGSYLGAHTVVPTTTSVEAPKVEAKVCATTDTVAETLRKSQ